MSAIITASLTVGVLFNKFRDKTANKLKEGDLTDEKCRQLRDRSLNMARGGGGGDGGD